jgi:hypothetical protein
MTLPGPKKLTDPKELRAIAHPLRNRLLTELFARQAATVTELAQAVGEPVNKVSFHLRLLGKYGFIVEAPELARDGRDRWWRPAYADGFDWDELAITHPNIVRAQHKRGLNQTLDLIQDYFSGAYERLPEWDDSVFSHDYYLRMTPEEAREFNREWLDFFFRWRNRIADELAAGDEAGRESFVVYSYGFPMPKAPEESETRQDA